MMRVFILGKSPFEEIGGYAAYSYSLSKCLRSLGYDAHIISLSSRTRVENTPIGTVHYINSKMRFLGTIAYPLIGLVFANYISKIVKDSNEKYVVHGIGPYGMGGAFLKRKHGNRVFLTSSYFTTLGDEVYWMKRAVRPSDYGITCSMKYALAYVLCSSFILKWFEKFLLDKNDVIMVHYDSSKKLLIRDYGVEDGKIAKIPYYVELYMRKVEKDNERLGKKLRESSKTPLCVTICRQDPRKGINYLLYAIKMVLQKYDVNMIIVGGGPLLEKNKALAKKLGLDGKVNFTGRVNDICPFLQEADLFVLPSLQEGSGSLSVLEAMKLGIPVIATKCSGGIDEDIEDGISGILVPPEDASSLAQAIQRVICDRSLSSFLSKNAAKTYNSKFNMRAMAEAISKIYNYALQRAVE
jgi:glycosyltransferase involved in cell wall biosynthesis